MFPPVESQVIFLSKETPIVNVGFRTAEVSYTNQNKTAWKSEVVQTLGWPLPIGSNITVTDKISETGGNTVWTLKGTCSYLFLFPKFLLIL
jgi:hypothetical protein